MERLISFMTGPQDTCIDLFAGSSTLAHAVLEPVSYTHLRAHETVLDLVCRLLLEKKNKLTRISHLRNILLVTQYNS